MRRATYTIGLLLFAMTVIACNDGYGDDDDATGDSSTTVAASTVEAIETRASDDATTAPPTPQQSPPGDGAAGEDEVQAIVGSVDAAGGVIAINRISGADVQRILVDTRTTIRSNDGDALRLSQVRPSDRIVARGDVEGDELRATEITVGQGVPGALPGG